MNDDKQFISPTMDWLYAKDSQWASDADLLYRLGFSRRSMRDVHGFDVFGFNDEGYDRLGCSKHDYRDQMVVAIGKNCGEFMSLSNKLPIRLPQFLKLLPEFERVCREHWETEPGWGEYSSSFPQDGKKRFYWHVGPNVSIGLHWFDIEDQTENFLALSTDTIAKLDSTDPDNDIFFRLISVGVPGHLGVIEEVICAKSADQAGRLIERHVLEFRQPVHEWTIRIVDTADGPALAALSRNEIASGPEGDDLGGTVFAKTRETALQIVMDNARSGTVEQMASRGIQRLTGELAVIGGPRI